MPCLKWMLFALAGITAGPLFAQDKSQLIPLASLLTNPEHYLGQPVATRAIVNESDAVAGLFRLTEIKAAGATNQSKPAFLTATWSKAAGDRFSESGQEAIAIGQIQLQNQLPILQVSNLITGKEAIRRFLRPFEKRPRPGDNLGHDAQLNSHLAE
jgi:hypothetical protein